MPLLNEAIQLGYSAELLVAYRFLEAGRRPALPLVPCPYDLLVDCGSGIYRVQTRRASAHIPPGSGARCYRCHTANNHRDGPDAAEFDYLCAVVEPNCVYVIPTAALRAAHDNTRLVKRLEIAEHGTRFAPYLNQFGIGSGELPEKPPADITKLRGRAFWHAPSASERKLYRRLSKADVDALRQIPIAITKRDEQHGGIPIQQIAQQFGVHVATLRNLLRGKRKDLKEPA